VETSYASNYTMPACGLRWHVTGRFHGWSNPTSYFQERPVKFLWYPPLPPYDAARA
jgi:hypothetical protein